jgi:Tol biopolymer transport system component
MTLLLPVVLALLPRLVGEGVLSTAADEVGITVTPDETEAYFVIRTPATVGRSQEIICTSRLRGGKWTEPVVAPFSGRFRDLAPALAPDGQKLYFISNRSADGSAAKTDFDIWVVSRQGSGWSAPTPLPSPVNSPAQEYGVSVAADGTLYFASTRAGGKGEYDIYRAAPQGDAFGAPELLGEGVNGEHSEILPAISPDGKTLVFTAFERDDELVGVHRDYRKGDLYVSHLEGGTFGPARNAGPEVNSGAGESSPMFSPDGKTLYFVSERGFATYRLPRRLGYRELTSKLAAVQNGMGNLYRVDSAVLP